MDYFYAAFLSSRSEVTPVSRNDDAVDRVIGTDKSSAAVARESGYPAESVGALASAGISLRSTGRERRAR